MNLTPHFTLEEMTFSSTAIRLSIDNTPPKEVIGRLTTLAQTLELVRAMLGYPLHIDSGYRCPDLNLQVGGAPDSAHMSGYAADFICPEFGEPLAIVQCIAKNGSIKFDQLIQEGEWVHLSVAPTMRGEVLTAHFDEGKRTTYTQGV